MNEALSKSDYYGPVRRDKRQANRFRQEVLEELDEDVEQTSSDELPSLWEHPTRETPEV